MHELPTHIPVEAPANPAPVVIDSGRNRRVALMAAGGFVFMLGMSFASVPLYDLFCRVTGYGGTTQVATKAPDRVTDRVFTVRFDANVAAGLGWRFEPEASEITLRAGEVKTVGYRVRNIQSQASTGIASFNVTPEQTGMYFNKIACFCFTEQTLQPGETRAEEVVFFIDPAMSEDKTLDSIQTITLSYTFFPVKTNPRPLADGGSYISPPAQAPVRQ
jgi:cytochrome c oxidase assembly protein subunit 11